MESLPGCRYPPARLPGKIQWACQSFGVIYHLSLSGPLPGIITNVRIREASLGYYRYHLHHYSPNLFPPIVGYRRPDSNKQMVHIMSNKGIPPTVPRPPQTQPTMQTYQLGPRMTTTNPRWEIRGSCWENSRVMRMTRHLGQYSKIKRSKTRYSSRLSCLQWRTLSVLKS